jgi:hypothetical protein
MKQKDDKNKSLQVNFDPALVRLLKEVKYFQQFNLVVPDNARVI